jgi:glycosyltransferase involved in cell wall biosynthesis
MERLAYRHADFSFVAAQTDRDYVEKTFFPGRTAVVPNFVDTHVFSPGNISRNSNIVFVGQILHQKNILLLIEAVHLCGLTLDVYGGGKRQMEAARLIIRLGVGDRIRLHGIVPNPSLPDILRSCGLYVLPSKYEGLPKTLLEAMACGCCCLGTDVPGIRDVIRHGENGWLCRAAVQDLAKSLTFLMDNPDLRQRLGEKARRTILEEYTLEKVTTREASLYELMYKEMDKEARA